MLFLARGWVAKTAVSAAVRAVTGLSLSIGRLEVGVFRSRIRVERMQLKNPPGFPDPVMVEIPQLYVDYNLIGFFQGRTHLRQLQLELAEFVVIKNRQGRMNLDSLTSVRHAQQKAKEPPPAPQEKAPPGKFQIDRLHLKIGKVVFKDYTGPGEPAVREFNVGIDESYENITHPVALGSLIVSRALVKTTIASLVDFDLSALQQQLSGAIGAAQRQGKEVLDSAAEKIKALFPFGKE